MALSLALPGLALGQSSGLVVEVAQVGFAAHEAGLVEGDLLLTWERVATPPESPQSATGELRSPFDLDEVELEQAPRGELTLLGTRGGRPLRVRMPLGEWKLRTRPRFAAARLARYKAARGLIEEERIEEGLRQWQELAATEDSAPIDATWLLLRVASTAAGHQMEDLVERAFQAARKRAEALGNPRLQAWVADARARHLRSRNRFESAAAAFRETLERRQARSPTSLATAKSLNDLGSLAMNRGDLKTAESYFRRALTLRERLAPLGLDTAKSLNNLGNVALFRGELDSAESLYRRSLAIKESHGRPSLSTALTLANLGIVLQARGDLAAAEISFRHALDISREVAPQSSQVAQVFNHLGVLAWDRGDLDAAEDFYNRSLTIRDQIAPGSLEVAGSLNNLGIIAAERDELSAAEDFFHHALAIRQELAPRSVAFAFNLGNLGEVALLRGDPTTAEAYLRRALSLYETVAPRSVQTAVSLHLLGDVARARTDFDAAVTHYERALSIHRERAPSSVREAESCHRLAVLHRQQRRFDQALAFYDCAAEALEAQKGKLGGSDELRSGFAAKHADIYRGAIDLLVATGKQEKAFHWLERYRARELLNLLAERDLGFTADLTPAIESKRRDANRGYNRAFNQWMKLSDQAGEATRRQAQEELERARQLQVAVRSEIRAVAPRLDALQNPRVLDLDAASEAFDTGTLLLSYSIGEERSYLFAVGSQEQSLKVVALDLGAAALRGAVGDFRQALDRGSVDPRPEKALLLSAQLSQWLLAPIRQRIDQAERLLILADGPLHSLPFAALIDPSAMDDRRFLIESKSIHHAASATVFARLKQDRRKTQTVRLTAFGDPQYPTPSDAAQELGLPSAGRRGLGLTPLPASRREVQNLEELYPEAARIYLGRQATEAQVKAVGKETTILHIAAHGLLDDRFPLDSALAMTIPKRWHEGEDNGLLQVWEIFEQVRLDADLVTLSACDTGRGKLYDGEGLLGMTRAFQYAGARSVLASLWSVSDRSTAELMRHFYSYLQAGWSKAEALRAAQLDLLRDPALAHPFHWAGFELVGDWQ
ncbi:MAG: CHAT domain-containing tetratricopeptide repeat protein [Acidobacteriota bacterium]